MSLLFQARKVFVSIFQTIVDDRWERRNQDEPTEKKDMMDILLEVEDENVKELNDEEIIDILVIYGHESSGHITMWVTVFLQKHPKVFKRAKPEAILRSRPTHQKGVTLKEIRQIDYLSKARKAKSFLALDVFAPLQF